MILYKSIIFCCDACKKSTAKFEGAHLKGAEIRRILQDTYNWTLEHGKHYCNDPVCQYNRKWNT